MAEGYSNQAIADRLVVTVRAPNFCGVCSGEFTS